MRAGPAAAVAAIFALTLVACDAPELPPDARVRHDTVGGVVHVVSGNRGAWVAGGSWTVPDSGVVIGAVDGPDEYVLGEVAGVALDDGGRIWVGDTQAKEVRVYDREGAFVTRFSRDGEGPGEFRNISGMAPAPDGIGVLDARLGRVTVFDDDGAVVRSFRIARPYMIFQHGAAMSFDDDGRFYDRTPLSSAPMADTVAVITYSSTGEPLDTAVIGAIERDHLVITVNGVPRMSFPRPFAPEASLAFGPEGTVYFSRGDTYRVEVLSPAGDTLRVIRREIRPRPVGDEAREAAMAGLAERYEQAGTPMPPGIDLPETRPAIEDLRVDREENLWVLTASDPSWKTLEWAVHDPDGRYLGAVATPVMNIMDIGEDYVAGVTWDELGVPRVRVMPIRK
ncbi:MAG: 6-bladed beta-propeller [Gemmatimonadetes bacterium]|nr:6-bladed beta-propeller [Gemmatimonadota bacterium]